MCVPVLLVVNISDLKAAEQTAATVSVLQFGRGILLMIVTFDLYQ